jgi:lipopolysaccharide transport system permease protein
VLVLVMWIYESFPHGWEILLAPVFLALALVAALGAGFFLSALNVRYRDVRYVIPVLLPVLPLVSGVIYEVQDLPTKWQWVLSLNPMTTVISGWRWCVVDAVQPDVRQSAVGVGVALAMFFVGLTVFRSTEPKFADTI